MSQEMRAAYELAEKRRREEILAAANARRGRAPIPPRTPPQKLHQEIGLVGNRHMRRAVMSELLRAKRQDERQNYRNLQMLRLEDGDAAWRI